MTQEQRIDELERQNRRFRRAGMVVLMTIFITLVVCAGLLSTSRAGAQPGAPKPNFNTPPWRDPNPTPKGGIVTGGEFRLVDDKGATRAVLYLDSGSPVLRFLDEQGIPQASVGLQPSYGPSLFFHHANGAPGVSIGVSANASILFLADSGGRRRTLLSVGSDGAPNIELRNRTGHVLWSALEPLKK